MGEFMSKKIAIITGASSGIGKAIAINFAEKNYHVILIARSLDKLEIVQKKIIGMGKISSIYPLDLTDYNRIQTCINNIMNEYGQIDLLFNNAGIVHWGTSEININELKEMIDINLLGAMYIGNSVANQMKKQNSGYIFNLASIAGKYARPMTGGYNASKFGFIGYSNALSQELIASNIKVTAICPDITNTPMVSDIIKTAKLDCFDLIQVEDIVNTVNYLLSLGASSVIKELIIDCKIMLQREIYNQMNDFNKTNDSFEKQNLTQEIL